MSYTQFVSTAKCQVADDFDLKDALVTIADFLGNHEDDYEFLLNSYSDHTHDDWVTLFEDYVVLHGNTLLINCDTEDECGNSEVWDFLIDGFLPMMTSNFMEINSATIDSRSGVECGTSFYMKDGTFIGSDDIQGILEQYVKMSS